MIYTIIGGCTRAFFIQSNLNIHQGEIYGLIGKNGAGHILGELEHTQKG